MSNAEVRVIASGGLKAAYVELVPVFERESGQKVATVFAGSTDIMKRIGADEAFDLIIMPGTFIDDLTRSGKIAAGSRVDLAKSGIVSKHREHRYRSGPSKAWLKIKNPGAPGILRFQDRT